MSRSDRSDSDRSEFLGLLEEGLGKAIKASYPPPEPPPYKRPPGGVGEESSRYGRWYLGDFDPVELKFRVPEREGQVHREFSMEMCEAESRSPYSSLDFVSRSPSDYDLELQERAGRSRSPADWGVCVIRPVSDVILTFRPNRSDRLDVYVREAGSGSGWYIRNVSSVRADEPRSGEVSFFNRDLRDKEEEFSQRTSGGTVRRGFFLYSPEEGDLPFMQVQFSYPYGFGPRKPLFERSSRAVRGATVEVTRDEQNDSYKLRISMPAHVAYALEKEREEWRR